MLKKYFMVVSLISYSVFLLGFLAPMLISAPSTELFLLGVFALVVSVPVIIWWVKKIFINKNKGVKDED